jgi:hypothetical protein
MRTATLLSTLSILASCASAGLIPRQDADIHIADFRTWGGKDCKVDNQGIWTFTKSDLTGCKTFASFGADNIQSINVVDLATGADFGAGCSCTYPSSGRPPLSWMTSLQTANVSPTYSVPLLQ